MPQAHTLRRQQLGQSTVAMLAIAASLLTGCQSAPQARAAGPGAVTPLAAVMSPVRNAAKPVAASEPVVADARAASDVVGTAPVHRESAKVEFLPMFASVSAPAFSPVPVDLLAEPSAKTATADAPSAASSLRFLPMLVSINSPARWSALLVLGDGVIVGQPSPREGVRR